MRNGCNRPRQKIDLQDPRKQAEVCDLVEATEHGNAGVVHKNVDRAEAGNGLFNEATTFLLLRNVGHDANRVATKADTFLSRRFQGLGISRGQSQLRAAFRKLAGQFATDTR